MAYPEHMRRTIVLKASRETLILVAAACGLTFALAYGIHSRPPPTLVGADEPIVPQDWTGGLVDISAAKPVASAAEPLTSAAMTVPKSALALPAVPRQIPVKSRNCEGAACPVKVAAPPAPTSRKEGSVERVKSEQKHRDTSLMAKLNPLNHVPDIVRKPFAYAGDTVSGWFRGL